MKLGDEAELFSGDLENSSALSVAQSYEFLRFFDAEQVSVFRRHEETKEAFSAYAIGNYSEGEDFAFHGPTYQFTANKVKWHYSDETLFFLAVAAYFRNGCYDCNAVAELSALDIFEMAARKGDDRAALVIAKFYLARFVFNKLETAYNFVELAIANGSSEAQLIKAKMLLNGIGVVKNTTKAKQILELYDGPKDADFFVTQGVFTEIENLESGSKIDAKQLYLKALGVEEDFDPFRVSLRAPNEALFRLGMIYLNEKKYAKAYDLLEVSALFGNRKAAHYIGVLTKTSEFSELFGGYSDQIAYMWLVASTEAKYVPASYDVTIMDTQVFDYDLQGLGEAVKHIIHAADADYLDAKELQQIVGEARVERKREVQSSKLTFGKVMLGLFALGMMEGLENGFNWDALGGQNEIMDDLNKHHNNIMAGAYWLSL